MAARTTDGWFVSRRKEIRSNITAFKKIFFLQHSDPIAGHGFPLRGFVLALIGNTTLGRTPLDE
jgi:hypothetical protein